MPLNERALITLQTWATSFPKKNLSILFARGSTTALPGTTASHTPKRWTPFPDARPTGLRARRDELPRDRGIGRLDASDDWIRVQAVDRGTERRFALYWRVIYPGSWLIRWSWLARLKPGRVLRDPAQGARCARSCRPISRWATGPQVGSRARSCSTFSRHLRLSSSVPYRAKAGVSGRGRATCWYCSRNAP